MTTVPRTVPPGMAAVPKEISEGAGCWDCNGVGRV